MHYQVRYQEPFFQFSSRNLPPLAVAAASHAFAANTLQRFQALGHRIIRPLQMCLEIIRPKVTRIVDSSLQSYIGTLTSPQPMIQHQIYQSRELSESQDSRPKHHGRHDSDQHKGYTQAEFNMSKLTPKYSRMMIDNWSTLSNMLAGRSPISDKQTGQ